jgi:hypothetical protein
MRLRFWGTIFSLLACSLATQTRAQSNLCSAVLSPTVFNIGETQNAELFASEFHNSFCDTAWQSANDVSNRGSSFGLNVNILNQVLGLNDSDYSNSKNLQEKYQAFCKKTVQDIAYSSSFFNRYRSSDFAVAQWTECIKNTSDGHFALVVPDEGLTGAIVRLAIRTTGTVPNLRITSVQPSGAYEVNCYYGSEPVTAAQFPPGITQVAVSCLKRADVAASIVLNTSWGAFDPIIIPGYNKTISAIQTDISQTRASLQADLKQAVQSLQSKMITKCQVCFQETEGSDQCQQNRKSCSDWASVDNKDPNWTLPFRDDTDNRPGGCVYQWRLICQ